MVVLLHSYSEGIHCMSFRPQSEGLCSPFSRVQSSRRFASMLEQRKKLPAWHERENILSLLEKSQVLVVSGMTGWVLYQCHVSTAG